MTQNNPKFAERVKLLETAMPRLNNDGGTDAAVYNKIFFGYKDHNYNLHNSPLIDSIYSMEMKANGILFHDGIIQLFAPKFWDEIVEPAFSNYKFYHVSICMKIKYVYGDYRSIGKYWAYTANDKNLFKESLIKWWIMKYKEQYKSEAFELDSIILSFKMLSDEDALLKIRAPQLRIMESKSVFINSWQNFPMIWDFLKLELNFYQTPSCLPFGYFYCPPLVRGGAKKSC
jgi:hypothetical protein